MTKEEMKVETEEILKNFLKDTTQWDLMTEEEMESRICTYQATGKTAELFKILSCLRLAPLYYCKKKGENNGFYISLKSGDYFPIFTSKKQMDKEDRKKYSCIETELRKVCDFLEGREELKGIVINYKTNHLVIEKEILFEMLKVLDEMEEIVDKAMEEGIEAEELTDILFERCNGRRVRIETKEGEIIEGETGIQYHDEKEFYMYVETEKGERKQVHKSDVKNIKTFPIE